MFSLFPFPKRRPEFSNQTDPLGRPSGFKRAINIGVLLFIAYVFYLSYDLGKQEEADAAKTMATADAAMMKYTLTSPDGENVVSEEVLVTVGKAAHVLFPTGETLVLEVLSLEE